MTLKRLVIQGCFMHGGSIIFLARPSLLPFTHSRIRRTLEQLEPTTVGFCATKVSILFILEKFTDHRCCSLTHHRSSSCFYSLPSPKTLAQPIYPTSPVHIPTSLSISLSPWILFTLCQPLSVVTPLTLRVVCTAQCVAREMGSSMLLVLFR